MNWQEMKDLTERAFEAPHKGDWFQEMYAFWVYVVSVGPKKIQFRTGSPREIRAGENTQVLLRKDFQKKFRYNSRPGFWVMFDRNEVIK